MRYYAVVLLIATTGGCRSVYESGCKGYFASCERGADRPPCESFALTDSTLLESGLALEFGAEALVAEVSAKEVRTRVERGRRDPIMTEFIAEAEGADAVWYYSTGPPANPEAERWHEGLIALDGCKVQAEARLYTKTWFAQTLML